MTFVGALEFDKRRIWFFASLYESRILFITIDGEMGLLMDFGDRPNFVLAAGGFHPRFPAPALKFRFGSSGRVRTAPNSPRRSDCLTPSHLTSRRMRY